MADNLSPLVNLDLINQIYKTINAQITERVYDPVYDPKATLGSEGSKYKSAWIDGNTSTGTLNGLTLKKADTGIGFVISGGTTSKALTIGDAATIAKPLTVSADTSITGNLTVSAATTIVQGLTVGASDTGTVTIKSEGTRNTTIVGPNGEIANLIKGTYTDSATTKNSTDPTNGYLLKIGEVGASKFLAGPASSSGTADYRTIAASDLPEASASANGIVTTGNQTFAGAKTFSETIEGNINGAAAKTAHSISITDGADKPVAAIDGWNGSADKTLTIKGDANSPIATTATDSTITITHAKKSPDTTADTSRGDTTDQTPGFGGTFKVTSATVDTYGHTTAFEDHTITIPSSIATKDANGLMSSDDWTKLSGIAVNAEVNQNAFSNVTVGNTTISADSKTDTVTLEAGDNITLTPDSTASKIAIKATDTTYTIAPGDNNGQIKVTPTGEPAYPVSVTGLQSAAYTKSTDYAPYNHVHNYASSSSAGGYALTSEKLEGFSKSANQSWGAQAGTFVHGEEVASANEEAGGCCWAFRKDCPDPGLISLFVDGKFYQDEGRYACIDTNGGTITGGLSVEGIASFTNPEASTDTSTGAVKISGGLGVGGDIYAGAVHNAVWNDLIDCMEVPENTYLEYGYCYSWEENNVIKSSRSSRNCIGIHSNTAGFAMGEKKTKTIRAAVAGFVLAYVDKLYPEGTPLTWGNDGVLTKCRLLKRVLHPERVIATFYREEKEEKWHDLPVSGRHWVKVR